MFSKTKVCRCGVAAVLVLLVAGMGLQLAMPNQAYSNGFPALTDYAGWSAVWWQWALPIPTPINPLLDDHNTAVNQAGPVWFLAGNWDTGSANRNVIIPADKYIFFPIVNTFAGNDPPAANTPHETVEHWRTVVFNIMQPFGSNLFCELDGDAVVLNPKTPIVRTQSPTFDFILPEDNIFGTNIYGPGNVYTDNVSDGYWVMLPPLPQGFHTLHFAASPCPPDPNSFSQNITYDINVVPLPGTLLLLGSGLLGLVGFGWRRSG
jgi:hypothetical protein